MGPKSSKPVYRCTRGHALHLAHREYVCDLCDKQRKGVSLVCLACDYDVCPKHTLPGASDPSLKEGKVALNNDKLLCANTKHPLSLLPRQTAWICDLCQAQHSQGTISAGCRECDYDECPEHRVLPPLPAQEVRVFSDDASAAADRLTVSPQQEVERRMRRLLEVIKRAPPMNMAAAGAVTTPPVASLGVSPGAELSSAFVVVRSCRRLDPSSSLDPLDASKGLQGPWSWGITSSQWTKPSVYDAPYVTIKDETHANAVFVELCDVEVSICSLIAVCTITLTFRNSSSKALEGDVVFPLPNDAIVNGYALEIDGAMVQASLVEAKQAEKIYEAEVKKGVDPGLLQKVAAGGNSFKTRVYPLPAGGTRRVALKYTQPLDALGEKHASCTWSLAFKKPVDMHVRGQILCSGGIPQVDGTGVESALLTTTPSSLQAGAYTLSYSNKAHCSDSAVLRVVVPVAEPDEPLILVEKAANGSGTYFVISDVAPKPMRVDAVKGRIGVVWDASLSRLQASREEELRVLSLALSRLDASSTVVDIFVVRDRVELVADLSLDHATRYIEGLSCDGATALRDLDSLLAPRLGSYDYLLMFSDGQSTIGDGRVPCIESGSAPPIFCINSSVVFNSSQLQHYWACLTGGAVLHVGQGGVAASAESVAALVASTAPRILGVDGCTNHNPMSRKSTSGSPRFLVSGVIPADAALDGNGCAVVRIRVGLSDSAREERVYVCPVTHASTNSTAVQTLWAQQRVSELEVFPDINHDEILEIARQFNVVTSSSSLLVLETLAQHLEHKVQPHPSRTDMYNQYLNSVSKEAKTEHDRTTAKLLQVEEYWKVRKEWYNTKFNRRAKQDRQEMAQPPEVDSCVQGNLSSAESCGAQPILARFEDQGECCAAPMVQRSMRRMDRACVMEACAAPMASSAAPLRFGRGAAGDFPGGGGGGERGGGQACAANATVKYWSPNTPYLKAIAQHTSVSDQYSEYLRQRKEYAAVPAFYFDVGGFFLNPTVLTEERRQLGIRVLSNIAELALDNSRILRVLGYKLFEAKEYELASEVFGCVGLWRPQEPQSYRDLALTLAERGWLQNALDLLWHTVTMEVPPSFAEIEVEALWEIRDVLARAQRQQVTLELPCELASRKASLLDGDMALDLRVTMGWDQDNVDIDLHVIEPSGEEAYYGHQRTEAGGLMSRDFRHGYGPESYVIRSAEKGKYRFKTNHFASHQPSLTGPTVAILTITTNFLRPEQKTVCTLIRLNEPKDNGEIGCVEI